MELVGVLLLFLGFFTGAVIGFLVSVRHIIEEEEVKTVIVPIKPGWIHKTLDGWYLYEVDERLVIKVEKTPALHELMACGTLQEVRELVK